jgi:hypothetical protein
VNSRFALNENISFNAIQFIEAQALQPKTNHETGLNT